LDSFEQFLIAHGVREASEPFSIKNTIFSALSGHATRCSKVTLAS
jgi:hypothetical protein